MADDRLPFFRRDAARVGEIDLVMASGCKVNLISLHLRKGVHLVDESLSQQLLDEIARDGVILYEKI